MKSMPRKSSKSTRNTLIFLSSINLFISLLIILSLIFGAWVGFRFTPPVSVAVDTPCPIVDNTSTPIRVNTPTPPQIATATNTPDEFETSFIHGEPMVIRYQIDQNYIRLPDGSEIILGPNSEIELNRIYGLTGGIEHEILLLRGTILVISQLPEGKWFSVVNPDGHIARVTGSVMEVGYNAETGEFTTKCVNGDCELENDAQALFQIAAKQEGWFDKDGNFLGPFEVDMDELRKTYGDLIPPDGPPTETPTNTPTGTATSTTTGTSTSTSTGTTTTTATGLSTTTPTGTPDIRGSATAACATFHKNFPLTPSCP